MEVNKYVNQGNFIGLWQTIHSKLTHSQVTPSISRIYLITHLGKQLLQC